MARHLLLFLISLLLLSIPVIRANEDVEVEEEDADRTSGGSAGSSGEGSDEDEYEDVDVDGEVGPHSQVETIVFFPQYPAEKRFLIGEPVTLLVGFSNKGDNSFAITAIGAHFHSPYDLSYYIQNFTRRYVSVVAEPNQQVTLEYKFTPDKSLEPLSFWLSGWVEYNGTEGVYRSTFLNGTVEVIEKTSDVNTRQFFTAVILLSIGGIIAYFFVFNTASSAKSGRKRRAEAPEQGTRATSGAASEDWGKIYKPKPSKASEPRKASRKSE